LLKDRVLKEHLPKEYPLKERLLKGHLKNHFW